MNRAIIYMGNLHSGLSDFYMPTLKSSSTSYLPNHLPSWLVIDGKSNRFPDFLELKLKGKNPKCESFKPWSIPVKELYFASKKMKAISSEEWACEKSLFQFPFRKSHRFILSVLTCSILVTFGLNCSLIFSSIPVFIVSQALSWASAWSLMWALLKRGFCLKSFASTECLQLDFLLESIQRKPWRSVNV